MRNSAAVAAASARKGGFASAFRLAPDPMCVMRAVDGVLIDANEAFERLVGTPRRDLLGKAFATAARWLDPPAWDQVFRALERAGEVRDVEAPMRRPDGGVAHVTASLRRVELGRHRCDVAVLRDVSTRWEAQLGARAASLYARSLIEASLDPLVTISPQGKITDVNRATEDATGLPRAELIGTDFASYFTEPEKARAGYEEVLARGEVRDYPLTMRHRSGLTVEVLYNASVYRNESGELQGVFAAARDITLRKQLEAEAHAASLYARSLIEASLDPLVTISPQGKITDVNRATEEATGLPRARLVGTDFASYFTEPERARAGYEQVLADGEVRDYPLTIRHGSGRTTDVLYNATVYRNEAGVRQGVFAAARDVTVRKRLEEEVRRHRDHLEQLVELRTAELETAYEELEGFSYSVSHDLRTPLRAIDGFSRVLVEEHRDQLDEEGRRLLGVIRQGTARMSQLIDDMLAFSRMGRVEMSIVDIDMAALARDVHQELVAAAPGREVRLDIRALPPARGDKAMLRQVLANLLGNAFKFTRSRAPALIEIGGATEGGQHRYHVKDNGVGFDMQYADKLFGVFQRLHAAKEFEGTGIGLALVKRIVARHGGRVWAEGRPGEGATFHFALPG
jgi:PAS domain S-box-containing protein